MIKNLKIIKFKNRVLLEIKGEDSRDFLQSIVTNNIDLISNNRSIYSALLTPQGKYLYDFFLFQESKINSIIMDCEKSLYEELIKKLTIYKLRSKVEIIVKDKINVYAIYGSNITELISNFKINNIEGSTKEVSNNLFFIDPRNRNLGLRVYSNNLLQDFNNLPKGVLSEWNYIRIKNKIPYPYIDLEKEKSFIIENNFEYINAIDFKKGCYIGQENTARQKYRGTAKRKLEVAKIIGKEILNGERIILDNKAVGTVRSSSHGLYLVSINSAVYENCKKNNLTINIKNSILE